MKIIRQISQTARRTAIVAVMAPAAVAAMASTVYTYRVESFEEGAFSTSSAKVTSATGEWTTNKNVSSSEQVQDGSSSLYFARKDGIMLPELTLGAGTLIYYAYDQNREAYVEVSADGVTWRNVETYKDTNPQWLKHVVTINDPAARWVRIRTASNSQFYIDNLLLTRPDGTDGDGNVIVTNLTIPYFTNTFEHTSYPQSKTDASSECSYRVDGQGEWLYLNAYKNTNEAYIPDGSARSLRMLKGSSYVVSPIVSQGVVKINFEEGRGNKLVNVYTSTDGGTSWAMLKAVTTDRYNEISVCDKAVNRIKIANESTKGDVDIDNITLTTFPEGTPATVVTGKVGSVAPSSAVVGGLVSDRGDREVFETGVCWAVGTDPTYDDHRVAVMTDGDNFTAHLSDLPAATEVWCRAYALGFAGIGYGEVVKFVTLPPALAVVETDEPTEDDFSDEKHIFYNLCSRISDYGGVEANEVGVVYSTTPLPELGDKSVKGYLKDDRFTVSLMLEPETTYYVRAYVTNVTGTSYGEEKVIVTGSIVIPDYEHNTYYCDPSGNDETADGSEQKPFYSLQKAVDLAKAGDIIYMNGGTYRYNTRVNIPTIGAPNSGMIRLESRNGRAILDFAGQGLGDSNQGIRLTGSYWHIYGLDIINAGDNGLLIERNKPSGGTYADIAARTEEGHDNVIEFCSFVRNQDTGLQMKNLASFNRVINCDAYYNTDPDHGDADGFAVKISHGTGNYFYGCRAWRNSDDGWDQFIKKEGGFPDDVTTTLEYCWAFENGILENGTLSKGNGNGFKMGSNEGRNNVIMNRCLAFENVNKGFDQNHNTGHMILNNCAGYALADKSNKSRYTYRLDEPVATGHVIRLTNCVSVSDGDDRNTATYAISAVAGTLDHCDLYTLPADYLTVSSKGMSGERQADGSLPVTDFLRPRPGSSKFVDRGVEVAPYDGESRYAEGIRYGGLAPDLGYYETDIQSGITRPTLSATPASSALHAVVSHSGLLMVTVDGAVADSRHSMVVYDMSGRMLGVMEFIGNTATVQLNAPANTILLIRVSGNGVDASLKVRMS